MKCTLKGEDSTVILDKGLREMKVTTEKFLRDAFAGESQVHMKYIAFALKAEEKNLSNVTRLFKAISMQNSNKNSEGARMKNFKWNRVLFEELLDAWCIKEEFEEV